MLKLHHCPITYSHVKSGLGSWWTLLREAYSKWCFFIDWAALSTVCITCFRNTLHPKLTTFFFETESIQSSKPILPFL